jgi:DNA primase large subunit
MPDLSNEDLVKIKSYYLKPEIIEKIYENCKKREIAPVFKGKFYAKRPSTMEFPSDIKTAIENGATSFHGSVELWTNPLLLENHKTIKEMNSIRYGWDLIIDIDCDEEIEIAQETALLIINELESYGIKNYSIKFSGNRGFHIGISHKSFPTTINYQNISKEFPNIPKTIVSFLKYKIKDKLTQTILKKNNKQTIQKIKTKNNTYDPYLIIDVEDNWSNRHLFRLPYSINEKSGLVSIPLKKEQIKKFTRKMAYIENINTHLGFLDKYQENETANLLMEAMDWNEYKIKENEKTFQKRNEELNKIMQITEAIDPQYFPPCIKNILKGIKDGRKRSIFILTNFFQKCGWPIEKIELELKEWNTKRNKEPISDSYLTGQLNYTKKRKESIMPPNCDSLSYYKDIQVCQKDNFCAKIKNPANYAIKRSGAYQKKETTYKCSICGKEFKTKQGLGNHKTRTHQTLRPGFKKKETTNKNNNQENKE